MRMLLNWVNAIHDSIAAWSIEGARGFQCDSLVLFACTFNVYRDCIVLRVDERYMMVPNNLQDVIPWQLPMRKRRGFSGNASPGRTFTPEGCAPACLFIAISQATLFRLTCSTIGTLNVGYVTAFTQGNDLPWNPQTVLRYQCTKEHLYDSTLTSRCQAFIIAVWENNAKQRLFALRRKISRHWKQSNSIMG